MKWHQTQALDTDIGIGIRVRISIMLLSALLQCLYQMFKNVISVTYEMASDTGIGQTLALASGQGSALCTYFECTITMLFLYIYQM